MHFRVFFKVMYRIGYFWRLLKFQIFFFFFGGGGGGGA